MCVRKSWSRSQIQKNGRKRSRALRAHTLCAPRMSCIIVQLAWNMMSMTFTYIHLWGQLCTWAESTCIMHSGHGPWAWLYNGQEKDATCDVCGLCQTIRSIFKPVCRWFWLIGDTYELLRCLDVEIWRFLWWRWQTDQLLYPCACVRGNNNKHIVLDIVIVTKLMSILNIHFSQLTWLQCSILANWCDYSVVQNSKLRICLRAYMLLTIIIKPRA